MSIDKLDKEIQEALDKNKLQSEAPDQEIKTYLAVYEALNSLPNEDYLPTSFADNVVSKIKVKAAKKDSEAFWWSLTVGAFGVEFGDFASKYLPMMALLSLVIVGVQWLDKRLVKLQV